MNLDTVVIGVGNWGSKHVSTLNTSSRLLGIFDKDQNKSKYISKIYQCHNYKSIDEISKDSRVKNIFITSSASTHFDLFEFFSKKNIKNFFIEKPICLRNSDLDIMKATIKNKNLKVCSGNLLHYHAGFQKVLSLIQNNQIGKVLSIKSYRQNFGKFRFEEDVIFSLMPHDLSMIFRILNNKSDDILNYELFNSKFLLEHTDESRMYLLFKNNVQALVSASWVSPTKRHELIVLGESGIISFKDSEENPNRKITLSKFDFDTISINETSKLLPKISSKEFINYNSDVKPLQNEIKYALKYFDGIEPSLHNSYDESYDITKFLLSLNKEQNVRTKTDIKKDNIINLIKK